MNAARAGLLLALAAGCGAIAQAVREEQERHRREDAACERGEGPACLALGERALATHARPGPSQGAPLVLAEARARFERACTLDVAAACLRLAESVAGNGRERALTAARRACELGLAAGCLSAENALAAPDPTARRLLLRRACDLDPRACPEAAGRVANIDATLMADLAARPCERELGDACAAAADLPGLADERRDELYARACSLGAMAACVRGGRRIERRNPQLAERLFRRACAAGDREGCGGLGRLLAATPD